MKYHKVAIYFICICIIYTPNGYATSTNSNLFNYLPSINTLRNVADRIKSKRKRCQYLYNAHNKAAIEHDKCKQIKSLEKLPNDVCYIPMCNLSKIKAIRNNFCFSKHTKIDRKCS